MLVSFSATNFRSIKDRQTLNLISARRDHDLAENLLPAEATESLGVRLMRTAVIYGANASGKSNLLKAIFVIRQLVVLSATAFRPDQLTGAQPFRLDAGTREQPSEFELVFLLDGIRHEYRVVVDPRVVHIEELVSFPKGRAALVYRRQRKPDGDYTFAAGSSWRGGDELHRKTRPNALMLSVGAQFNHDQLSRVYAWFLTRLHYWDLSGGVHGNAYPHLQVATAQLIHGNEDARRSIEALLAQADLGIAGLRTRAIKPEELQFPPGTPEGVGEIARSDAAAGRLVDTRCLHRVQGSDEVVEFSLGEESAGTQRFFSLLGPIRQILADGACIVIDELDASLHPLLVRAVIAMLHDPLVNKNNAQAIVTTHDTTLMNQELVRRDQVWFTEKGEGGGTTLYPLTDYKPKQDEALQRGYLGGRYGGVPILPARLGA